MYFSGYDLWIHKLNFGTFTGHVSYKLPARFEAFDQSKALITDRDLDGKVVLLDFWHTRCGACFKKFPELQRLFDEYKANPSVAILAVDKPLEDDAEGQAFQMIKEEKYTFPVVVAKNENLPELYDVEVYPTTMVINRQGTVVFRGRIEDAARQVEKLISAR